jgi:hypothetical protein
MNKNDRNEEKSAIGQINVSGGQVNIVGKGVINQYNAGSSGNISREDFVKLVRQVEEALRTANIDIDTKSAVQSDLKAAVEQSQRQNPQPGLILNRLKSALDLVTSLGGAVAAGQTIYPLLQQAYEIAKNLFLK